MSACKKIAWSLIAACFYAATFATIFLGQDQEQRRPILQRVLANHGKQTQSVPDPQPETSAAVPPSPTQYAAPPLKPATPPKVNFKDGMLSIVAENSVLADILRAVRTKTGAVMEVPANATERVVVQLGPGPAREVLASLLNGSHFNYVILGSATDPDAVQQVILTTKSGGGGAQAAADDQAENQQQDGQEGQEQQMAEEPAADDSNNNDADNQQENQPEPPQAEEQPQQPAAPVKSPEEMLRELQQQQQQMQQQLQQQQQQAPQNPPPSQEPQQ